MSELPGDDTNLPERIQLDMISPVYDQGELGSAVAYAMSYALEWPQDADREWEERDASTG